MNASPKTLGERITSIAPVHADTHHPNQYPMVGSGQSLGERITPKSTRTMKKIYQPLPCWHYLAWVQHSRQAHAPHADQWVHTNLHAYRFGFWHTPVAVGLTASGTCSPQDHRRGSLLYRLAELFVDLAPASRHSDPNPVQAHPGPRHLGAVLLAVHSSATNEAPP